MCAAGFRYSSQVRQSCTGAGEDVPRRGGRYVKGGAGCAHPASGEGELPPSGSPGGPGVPEDLAGISYYQPTGHGSEAAISERMAAVRKLLGR